MLTTTGCFPNHVDDSHIGIHYTEGPIEGRHFEAVVQPGDSASFINDKLYELPARQITYVTGSAESGADGPTLQFTTADGVRMNMDLTVRAFLNSSEDAIRQFFTSICQKDRQIPGTDDTVDGCWEDASGEGPRGWNLMLQDMFGDPMTAIANDLGGEQEAEPLRYDAEVKDEFAASFADRFSTEQRRLSGAEENFFCGPGYEFGSEECPPLSVEVTRIRFASDEREGIREAEALAIEQRGLAREQAETARAQQAVAAAESTPEQVLQEQLDNERLCAESEGCNMIINRSDSPIAPTVPVG